MNKDGIIRISGSEWQVMRVVWTNGKSDASEIFQLLSEPMNWKMATIKTLLGRLVKKEALTTEQIGKKFVYYPNIKEEVALKEAINDLLSRVCSTKIEKIMSDVIDEVDFTKSDINSLIDKLQKKETVPFIQCSCLPGQCHCHKNRMEMDK